MEYRYTPRAKNRNIPHIILVLAILSFLFLLFGMRDLLGMRAVWELMLLFVLVAALFLYLRYIATSYCYIISEEAGEPMLVIVHTQGRRVSTHCRLRLSRMTALVEVPDETAPEGKAALAAFRAEQMRYTYRATLGRGPTQLLYGSEGRQRFALRIEGDEGFVAALREAAARAALCVTGEEEDEDE